MGRCMCKPCVSHRASVRKWWHNLKAKDPAKYEAHLADMAKRNALRKGKPVPPEMVPDAQVSDEELDRRAMAKWSPEWNSRNA